MKGIISIALILNAESNMPNYTWLGVAIVLVLPIIEKALFVNKAMNYKTLVKLLSMRNLIWFFDAATAIAYILYHFYDKGDWTPFQPGATNKQIPSWIFWALNILTYVQTLMVFGVIFSVKNYSKFSRIDSHSNRAIAEIRGVGAPLVR